MPARGRDGRASVGLMRRALRLLRQITRYSRADADISYPAYRTNEEIDREIERKVS